jgi:xylulokinase
MANVLGRELLVPEQKSAAYGACLLAGMGTGLYPREPERLTDQIRMSQVYVPEADLQQKYAALQKTYADISIAIAGISHRLESLSRSSPFDQIGDRIH